MNRTEQQQQQIENLPESQTEQQLHQSQATAEEAESVKGGIIIIGGVVAVPPDPISPTAWALPAVQQQVRPASF